MERLIKVMDKYLSEAKKKILTLTVSKQWFDKIVSGEKTEEYREIKPYWASRLVNQQAKSGEVLFDEFGIEVFLRNFTEIKGIQIEQWNAVFLLTNLGQLATGDNVIINQISNQCFFSLRARSCNKLDWLS